MQTRTMNAKVKKLMALESQKRGLELQIEALKSEIRENMDDDVVVTTRFIIRNTSYTQTRVNSNMLRIKHPRIFKECSTEVTSHRFSYSPINMKDEVK